MPKRSCQEGDAKKGFSEGIGRKGGVDCATMQAEMSWSQEGLGGKAWETAAALTWA